jgi:hypothetical protein
MAWTVLAAAVVVHRWRGKRWSMLAVFDAWAVVGDHARTWRVLARRCPVTFL